MNVNEPAHEEDEIVKKEDAAIIFAPDGTPRILIPKSGPNEYVSEGAMWATRCALFIHDAALVRSINKRLRKMKGKVR